MAGSSPAMTAVHGPEQIRQSLVNSHCGELAGVLIKQATPTNGR
jgi:hypothetical protein